jgi:hypothetical protein
MLIGAAFCLQTILKGVADLKKNGGLYDENKRPASRHANKVWIASVGSACTDFVSVQYADGAENSAQKKVHHSHTKPLTEQSVNSAMDNANAGDAGTEPLDLANGEFNESDSHALFTEALNEWRTAGNGAGKTQIETIDDGEVQVHDSSTTEPPGGNLWVNPAFDGSEPSAASSGLSQERPETEVLGGKGSNAVDGGKLLKGSFDEEKEHKQFQQAVDAWRKGKHGPPTAHSKGATGDGDIAQESEIEMQSCWYSYVLFEKDQGLFDKETQHWFKNAANCEEYKRELLEKEAEREKRKRQLEELFTEQEEDLATSAPDGEGGFALQYDSEGDEYDEYGDDQFAAPTTIPVIEEIESSSFDGHWDSSADAHYTVEEVEELQDMDVRY